MHVIGQTLCGEISHKTRNERTDTEEHVAKMILRMIYRLTLPDQQLQGLWDTPCT